MKIVSSVEVCDLCKRAGLASVNPGDFYYCPVCTLCSFRSGSSSAGKIIGKRISEFVDRMNTKKSEYKKKILAMKKLQDLLDGATRIDFER